VVISSFDENFEGGLMGVARKNKCKLASNRVRVVLCCGEIRKWNIVLGILWPKWPIYL